MPDIDAESQRLKKFTSGLASSSPLKAMMAKTTRKFLSTTLSVVRTGPETVLMIPPVARGGNWLYEWMKAYTEMVRTGHKTSIIYRPGMETWIEEFPQLGPLTTHAQAMRFRSKRAIGFHQSLNNDFSEQEVRNFIHEVLLSSSDFKERRMKAQELVPPQTLVINIRRGDYYTYPLIEQQFGIATEKYIRAAIQKAKEECTITQIVVTSDDLKWCSENLTFLQETAPTSFEKFGEGMFDDLAILSVASHLILTNTTFGYWGAYIAEASHPTQVWAPNIHERATSHHAIPPQHMRHWQQVAPESGSWLPEL